MTTLQDLNKHGKYSAKAREQNSKLNLPTPRFYPVAYSETMDLYGFEVALHSKQPSRTITTEPEDTELEREHASFIDLSTVSMLRNKLRKSSNPKRYRIFVDVSHHTITHSAGDYIIAMSALAREILRIVIKVDAEACSASINEFAHFCNKCKDREIFVCVDRAEEITEAAMEEIFDKFSPNMIRISGSSTLKPPIAQSTVERVCAILENAKKHGATVLAHGIDNTLQRRNAQALGVQLIQGQAVTRHISNGTATVHTANSTVRSSESRFAASI